MFSLIASATQFVRENDFKTILQRVKSHDAHPSIQFLKYAVCGGLATATLLVIVTVLSMTVFPASKGAIINGEVLDEAVRKHNIILNNTIAFPFSGIVGYILNVMFVFKPGKHSRGKEMFLFFLVAAAGFFPGLWLVDYLVGHYHIASKWATVTFIITSFMVNFVFRKFVIFKG
ncbi:MAG: GtrA family protein [Verrucomicrobiaceae bacterium]|nr:GtrA family protein [Verrucomicrobiaceae bacterium]